jgi:hypothetical protein
MRVFFTLSAALRLAFWLFVLGIALGLALGLPATGASVDEPPAPCPDAVCPAPETPAGDQEEVLHVQIHAIVPEPPSL